VAPHHPVQSAAAVVTESIAGSTRILSSTPTAAAHQLVTAIDFLRAALDSAGALSGQAAGSAQPMPP